MPEELSEIPYVTRRAIDFMEEAGDQSWLCHLSFIKPHWPYIVPAPYHAMYGPEYVIPPVRSEAEKATDHPVYKAYIEIRICRSFARDEVRARVIPAYMGLIKQIDDQMGKLLDYTENKGLLENTMIVVTSDHGDYLGDHRMGEKDLFHDQSVKVPLIVYDPRKSADATRGQVRDELVKAIDLAPMFLDYFGGTAIPHILEGRNLDTLLHDAGALARWREFAISEYYYATREAREMLGIAQDKAQLFMIHDVRWKLIYAEGFRPMLFDLTADLQELVDLGASDAHATTRTRMTDALFAWARQHHSRITVSPDKVDTMLANREPPGIVIGF